MKAVYLMPFSSKSVLLFHALKSKNEKVLGFFDNDHSITGMNYEGCIILSPLSFEGDKIEANVILCEPRHYKANKIQLTQLGFSTTQLIDHLLLAEDVASALSLINKECFSKIVPKQHITMKRLPHVIKEVILPESAKKDNSLVLDILDIIVTEKCTLKCKKCANLMQYFTNPEHMSLEQIFRDIDLAFAKIDWIRRLYIFGGEALMYKQFAQVLTYASRYKRNYGNLYTTTNGTVVPSEDTLRTMYENGMIVIISDYGDRSHNMDVFLQQLESYKITYVRVFVRWYEYHQLVEGDNRDAALVFSTCKENCATLRNGLLYRCPFLAHAERLHAVPYSNLNHIDISNEYVDRYQIACYLADPEHYTRTVPPACAYCSGYDINNMREVPIAEQIDKPLPYKKYKT